MDVNLQDSKILTQNKNFIIRNFEKNDIDSEFISWFKNKKNFKFSRHQNKNYTEKELINYHQKHKKNPNSMYLVCESKTNGQKISTLTIYFNKEIKTANIGILIGSQKNKNKGYGFKILKLVFNYLFENKKINQIIMGTEKNNLPMVFLCKKLSMKKKNQFNLNSKIINNFYLNKKNFNIVGIISKDSGSANQILHFVLNKPNKFFLLLLENPAKKMFHKLKINNIKFCKSVNELAINSDYVLSGTGNTEFEKKNMSYIEKNKVDLYAVLDHYTNIKKRFIYKRKIIKPKKIIIFDNTVYQKLKNRISAVKKPNFYLKYLREKLKEKKNKKFILFIGEPFEKKINGKTLDLISFEILIKNFDKFGFLKNNHLIIRLHPKQNGSDKKKYASIINRFNKNMKFSFDKNKELYKSLSISKYVFGITSYALLLSSYLKIKTFDCIKPSQKIRSLPSKNINSFYKLLAD